MSENETDMASDLDLLDAVVIEDDTVVDDTVVDDTVVDELVEVIDEATALAPAETEEVDDDDP